MNYVITIKFQFETQQINFIINRIASEWTLFVKVFYNFLLNTDKSIYHGYPVITWITISNCLQFLTNADHKILISMCYLALKG